MKLNYLKFWFLLAIVITALSLLVYLEIQQDLRQGANDPQIQVAEDIARSLDGNQLPAGYDSSIRLDISKTLSTFVIIYDNNFRPVAGTAQLNNSLPTIPDGVLQFAKANGENRITWQPQKNIRIALVVVPYKNGFVVSGRSLREVESRANKILIITILAWLSTIVVTLLFSFIFRNSLV